MRAMHVRAIARKCLFQTGTRKDEFGWRWQREGSRCAHIASLQYLSSIREIRKNMPTAKKYLEINPSIVAHSDILLEYGEEFQSQDFKHCRYMEREGLFSSPGKCFENSLGSCFGEESPKLVYVEGVAVCPRGAYHHAWTVYNGMTVDFTWPDGFQTSYFGIRFDPQKVLDLWTESGKTGMLNHSPKEIHSART